MDTRVSLKAALDAQGFRGNSRGNTEWKRWVESEKEELAKVMTSRRIEWLKKGTHVKHLSVLDFEKRERVKEVKQLEKQIKEKDDEIIQKKRRIDLILSRLVDTFYSRILNPIQLLSGNYSIAVVLP